MVIFERLSKTVEHEGQEFTLVRYQNSFEGEIDPNGWTLGLVLEPDSIQDGCDVEELDELTAIDIMGQLFNIHIYDNKTGVSRL